jgi:HEPN domain-containing protein
VSWFSQQAVEKGLKALLSEHQGGVAPPRTHDLEFLGDELSVPTAVRTDLAILNPVFRAVRYPDLSTQTTPAETISHATAQRHFDAAERVMAWLAVQLILPSTRP